jgi:hypothetical protein
MDTNSTANETPLLSLLRRGFLQAWKPSQRGGYFATIGKDNTNGVISEGDSHSQGLKFDRQSAHAISPQKDPCSLQLTSAVSSAHDSEIP